MRQLEFHVDGTGTAALEGPARFQASLTDNGTGDYTVTFDQPFADIPICSAISKTANVICMISSISATAVRILTKSLSTGTASVPTSLGVLGSANVPVTHASIVMGDLTFVSLISGVAGNALSIEFTTGGTAGAEVVSIVGNAIAIQIQDAVSTGTQVLAAFNASTLNLPVHAFISGTAGNPQAVTAATNLASGVDGVASVPTSLGVLGSASVLQSLTATDADFNLFIVGSDNGEEI